MTWVANQLLPQNISYSLNYFIITDSMRRQSQSFQPTDCWRPPYVGRCIGECDVISCRFCQITQIINIRFIIKQISQSKYLYPLTLVRPDYLTFSRDTPQSMMPTAPDLPYSKHTPPQWMTADDPEKYFKAGRCCLACLCNFPGASAFNLMLSIKQI